MTFTWPFRATEGATWGKNFRVTERNSAWGPGPHNLSGAGHASYDCLAADGGNFYVAWTDERSGDADVYAAVVPETFDASAPDFDLSAVFAYAAIPQGGTATFDLAATGVNGFTGSLALDTDLAPPGLTLSLSSPSAAPGETVRLTVTAERTAPARDYVVGVSASSGGLVRGTRMRLTVTEAASSVAPPVNVTRSRGFATGAVKADPAGILHAVDDDDSRTGDRVGSLLPALDGRRDDVLGAREAARDGLVRARERVHDRRDGPHLRRVVGARDRRSDAADLLRQIHGRRARRSRRPSR